MKKLLLLTALPAMGLSAYAAETAVPTSLPDVRVVTVSTNGNYAVSMGSNNGMRILNLADWNESSDTSDFTYPEYTPGHGRCASDNGIVVGVNEEGIPQYWKDGEWYDLQLPEEVVSSNLANAITADGSRICGSLGMAPLALDGDALMQVPCIWNADGNGYGMPIILPHPEKDFEGRIPQYVTAIDMSADGKTIVGQVRDAVGYVHYTVIYREDEKGEWSYELPHYHLINPDGIVIPEFPGEGPVYPTQESYMTPEELADYLDALQAYYNSGYQLPYPQYEDYMTPEEIAEYEAAFEHYQEEALVWEEAYEKWAIAYQEVADTAPGCVFNSIMISPDGKTYGCTMEVINYDRPSGWMDYSYDYQTWVFNTASGAITKYEGEDINLSNMCNDGIALACTSAGTATFSYVLKDGAVIPMLDWMKEQAPAYASWIEDNMVYEYAKYNWDTDEIEYKEELMTGFPVATPDLSLVILSVDNVWDYMDDGEAYAFDMKVATGVETVKPAVEEQTIYDLSGRKLKEVSAPGIYIINGEKKVVR